MTESEHTTTKLARALEAIPGVPGGMIQKARDGYYHDFLSPLATPEMQLVADLRELASQPATPRNSRDLLRELAQAVINGEHDASTEESHAWAQSAEGQATFAELGNPPGKPAGWAPYNGSATEAFTEMASSAGGGDAIKACADLVSRTGAKSFECGYVHEGVPVSGAGWYATAMYQGARITAEDKSSPAGACYALAVRLLAGAQCQHCKGLVALVSSGAFAFQEATLTSGERWDASDAAKTSQCLWRLVGDQWIRGCE
jgi:hypothetical protein